jgi:GNAT superfamily N-acetyltransferase
LISTRLLDSLDGPRITTRWNHVISIGELDVLVAVDEEGTVVGFASGGLPSDPTDGFDCELHKLYIRRDLQRCGIGRSLLQALAARLSSHGFRTLIAHVLPGTGACEFSHRMGAELIRETTVNISGEEYLDAMYGWRDLRALAREATTPAPGLGEKSRICAGRRRDGSQTRRGHRPRIARTRIPGASHADAANGKRCVRAQRR